MRKKFLPNYYLGEHWCSKQGDVLGTISFKHNFLHDGQDFGLSKLWIDDKNTPPLKRKAGDPAQVARYFVFYLVI